MTGRFFSVNLSLSLCCYPLDNRLSQSVQDIRRSQKVHRRNHEKLESGLSAGRKSLTEVKIQSGTFLRDATQSYTRKCPGRYKLYKSQENINHLMYLNDIKLFAKNEKEPKTLIQAVRIYSQDIGMEFGREKCVMLIMGKRKTANDGRNRTTKSEKNQKSHQRDKHLECPPCKIIGTILKVNEGRRSNGTCDGDTNCSRCTQNDPKRLVKGREDLEIRGQVETIQTTALLRSTRILRGILETCCQLNSSEKPSANVGAKNSKRSKIRKL